MTSLGPQCDVRAHCRQAPASTAAKCSGTTLATDALPPVMAAAISSVAASMRSGMIAMPCAGKLVDAVISIVSRAQAVDPRAQRDQKSAQVDDLGLARGAAR